MPKKLNYNHTIYACFIGYIVQAIVNNFAPLLFVTLSSQYHISLEQISILISFNFGIQLCIDFLSTVFIDRIGYKNSAILAHLLASIGLILFALLPQVINPFLGLLLSVVVYAMGGGLLEVLISPIVEACPSDNKEAAMSLLHSFYCWGHVAVVLLSTLFFTFIGIKHWSILSYLWALVPIVNMLFFMVVPVPELESENAHQGMFTLLKNKLFWLIFIMMLCAGACEQSVSQWVSAFAEKGLGISKSIGDLAGPLTFALLMGTARVVYSKISNKVDIHRYMLMSTGLCIFSYLLILLSPIPVFSFLGCAICGFSVGVLWPGTLSLATKEIKGGTAMFALLALAGDVGCSSGPGLVGLMAEQFNSNLQLGIGIAAIFPIILFVSLVYLNRTHAH